MPHSIMFIAPYKRLGELFTETCQDLGVNIPVILGDLEEGAKKAVQLEEEGVDVVISRGGTALAIKKEVMELPVVEVQVSGFDLIQVLHKARLQAEKIAVAGFAPFTHGIEVLEEILGIQLRVITLREEWYDRPKMIEDELMKIKEEGFNLVVGDNISVKKARDLEINAFLVRSGKDALVRAILEAQKVASVRKNEMEKTKRLMGIINSVYEGIIGIDATGTINIFNAQAEQIMGTRSYKVVGKNIEALFPDLALLDSVKKGQKQKKIWKIGKQKLAASITPITVNEKVVGGVATFQQTSGIQKMEQKIREELYLKGHTANNTLADIIGNSPPLTKVKNEAQDYAKIDSPLLLCGETGTGKELFAQAVHNAGPRRDKPFVPFNCAALPENLLESELFGYVKGAFTGATEEGKVGLFEQAHEGTVFLDEIGEISYPVQARLLRVLQERKVRRIGDDKLTAVDVRITVATNRDLHRLVVENRFREDLYYRINVLQLNIPPLRERIMDIPGLVDFFIKRFQVRFNKVIKGFSGPGMDLLMGYHWPGNVRQLENIVERLVVRTKEGYILTGHVKEVIHSLPGSRNGKSFFKRESDPWMVPIQGPLKEIEKEVIRKVLQEEGGNKKKAARRLDIGRTTLWRKLKD